MIIPRKTKQRKVKKSKEKYVCVPSGTHGHIPEEAAEIISNLGYAWDAEEIRRFIDYNDESGWRYSPDFAAKKWEENRRIRRSGKHSEPEITAEERSAMTAYLTLMNRFRKEDG